MKKNILPFSKVLEKNAQIKGEQKLRISFELSEFTRKLFKSGQYNIFKKNGNLTRITS